jgi:DNA-binding NarL/FixJ family response regulator
MGRVRVLIVDDHPVFLEGLYTILSLKDPEIEVVGTALNGAEALEKEEVLNPDVVLLDIKMPVMDGVELARRMRARREEIKIIMLTTFDDAELIKQALSAGAKGYLLKDAHAVQIIEAIKHTHRENVVLSGDLALRLTSLPSAQASKSASQARSGRETGVLRELSERELDVLRLLARGRSNVEIGRELSLSEKTIRNYISHIYEVLNIHTRTKAALWALENLKS